MYILTHTLRAKLFPFTLANTVCREQFLWALLVMAIVGNMIHEANGNNPSIVNYAMFVAVFGMLSLFYLIPATIKDTFVISPMFPLIVDLLNTLFWFCGAVALAAELGVHSCSNGVCSLRLPSEQLS